MSRRVRTTDLLVAAVASSISGVSRRRNVVQRIIGTTHPSILTSWFSMQNPLLARRR